MWPFFFLQINDLKKKHLLKSILMSITDSCFQGPLVEEWFVDLPYSMKPVGWFTSWSVCFSLAVSELGVSISMSVCGHVMD